MHNTKRINDHAANFQATNESAGHESIEIAKLDITEHGEWGRPFRDAVKLTAENAADAPRPLSLLDELNSLDQAA